MTIQITKSQYSFAPFYDIDKKDLICFEIIEKNEERNLDSTKVLEIKNEGIFINCRPSINDNTKKNSILFQNKTSLLNKNKKFLTNVIFSEDIDSNNLKQINEQKNYNSFINETNYIVNNIRNVLNILNSNSEKSTRIINLDDLYTLKDQRLVNTLGINPYFNDSLLSFNYPSPIKILNNEVEKDLLQLDDPLANQLTNSIRYPMNHTTHISFEEGMHIEPFAFTNQIQFKTKQEYEFNRFHSNINNSQDNRGNVLQFTNKFSSNETKNISFFDNINSKTLMIKSTNNQLIDSYIEEYYEDNTTGNIFDSQGRLSRNRKYRIRDASNTKSVLSNSFISPDSFIFLNNSLPIKPFNDNDKNTIYSDSNYNDLTFKEIFKNNKLIENIQNRQSNIYYEKNEKFSSCGFDWSYTNSIGKNSIAFKGLE